MNTDKYVIVKNDDISKYNTDCMLVKLASAKIHREKKNFGKLIYILNFVCVMLITVTVIVGVFLSGKLGITDMAAFVTVITVAWAELGVHTHDYHKKSTAENILKIGYYLDKKPIKQENLLSATAIMQDNPQVTNTGAINLSTDGNGIGVG